MDVDVHENYLPQSGTFTVAPPSTALNPSFGFALSKKNLQDYMLISLCPMVFELLICLKTEHQGAKEIMKFLCVIASFMFIFVTITATAQNRVLQLDGDGDYVRL